MELFPLLGGSAVAVLNEVAKRKASQCGTVDDHPPFDPSSMKLRSVKLRNLGLQTLGKLRIRGPPQ